jgi:hypothetical protein
MALQDRLLELITVLGTDHKAIRTMISGSATGGVGGLDTVSTNIVDAINEALDAAGAGAPDASETVKGIVEMATLAEVATGTDTTRAVTPAGVRQERTAIMAAILDTPPGTLDTLNELAAALADDPNFATTMTTALAGKQPLDTDLTAIAALTSAADRVPYSTGAGTWALATFTAAGRALVDDADVAAQRATLSVYSQAQLGDPDTDLAALYATAKT